MNPEIKSRWLAALRSGKFAQGTGRLTLDNSYCCLGVLAHVAKEELQAAGFVVAETDDDLYVQDCWGNRHRGDLMAKSEATGMPSGADQSTLIAMNDGGESFDTIADWIEENL